MTYNPFWIEATDKGLRVLHARGEKSTLYIYEAEING